MGNETTAANQAKAAAPEKASGKSNAATKTVPGLRIRSLRDGFRRAGRSWNTTPTEVLANEFTQEQIAALKAEPMLVVEDIEVAGTEEA